ncbi:transposase, partial [Patescibacteria group bacterium]|nr:transposase [Patescibacteria group bacterium]
IVVEYVDPAYTSQMCATCGELGERRGDVFRCTTCGEFHADTNAAWNIAGGGAVVNRPVSGADVSSMGHPKAACFSWQ